MNGFINFMLNAGFLLLCLCEVAFFIFSLVELLQSIHQFDFVFNLFMFVISIGFAFLLYKIYKSNLWEV